MKTKQQNRRTTSLLAVLVLACYSGTLVSAMAVPQQQQPSSDGGGGSLQQGMKICSELSQQLDSSASAETEEFIRRNCPEFDFNPMRRRRNFGIEIPDLLMNKMNNGAGGLDKLRSKMRQIGRRNSGFVAEPVYNYLPRLTYLRQHEGAPKRINI